MSTDRGQFLAELSAYYIQTRYPEEIESSGAHLTREIAEEAFRQTNEVAEWLFSLLR